MAEKIDHKVVQAEELKESLKDTLAVMIKLSPHCHSFEELIGLIQLAVGDEETEGNDAQLRILIHLMKSK
jgi:hypothetical protein